MRNNWFRKLIGGLSFTSALFVFQACYGTPHDFNYDILIEGEVKSKASGMPIQGIVVSSAEDSQYDITDIDGKFSMYLTNRDSVKMSFQDVDSTSNGLFLKKDTILRINSDSTFISIKLEDK